MRALFHLSWGTMFFLYKRHIHVERQAGNDAGMLVFCVLYCSCWPNLFVLRSFEAESNRAGISD